MPSVQVVENQNRVQYGKDLVKAVKQHYKSRKDYSRKEIAQAVKEGAEMMRSKARGRIMFLPVSVDFGTRQRKAKHGRTKYVWDKYQQKYIESL